MNGTLPDLGHGCFAGRGGRVIFFKEKGRGRALPAEPEPGCPRQVGHRRFMELPVSILVLSVGGLGQSRPLRARPREDRAGKRRVLGSSLS